MHSKKEKKILFFSTYPLGGVWLWFRFRFRFRFMFMLLFMFMFMFMFMFKFMFMFMFKFITFYHYVHEYKDVLCGVLKEEIRTMKKMSGATLWTSSQHVQK
jgi:hypothetical protein